MSEDDPNPSGICECGCGQSTRIVPKTDKRHGVTRGHHFRYVHGHRHRFHPGNHKPFDMGYITPCWIWLGRTDPFGYGRLGGSKLAHRAYYRWFVGNIPDDCELDHLCHEPSCVNPEHLECVSHKTNLRRGKVAVLTPGEVRIIKQRLKNERVCDIARDFPISPQTIHDIDKGRSWRDVS